MINFNVTSSGFDKRFEISLPMQEVAELVRSDIEESLLQGRKAIGGNVAPLKPSTIARKHHSIVFLQTGQLRQSVQLRKTGKESFEVSIAPSRKKIAGILHYGTKRMKSRPFFPQAQAGFRRVLSKIKTILETKMKIITHG